MARAYLSLPVLWWFGAGPTACPLPACASGSKTLPVSAWYCWEASRPRLPSQSLLWVPQAAGLGAPPCSRQSQGSG